MRHDAPEAPIPADHERVAPSPGYGSFVAPCAARDIAADIRRRLPGVPATKLHKLLYYAQGHHLSAFGKSLFVETLSAWDHGPVVGQLWYAESQDGVASDSRDLGEAELNTIGYVVSRYGRLSAGELERLTHGEPPWRDADAARRGNKSRTQRIENDAIRSYFELEPDAEDTSEPVLDPLVVRAWLQDSANASHEQLSSDTAESLLARLR